jgi:hypothetical protein
MFEEVIHVGQVFCVRFIRRLSFIINIIIIWRFLFVNLLAETMEYVIVIIRAKFSRTNDTGSLWNVFPLLEELLKLIGAW